MNATRLGKATRRPATVWTPPADKPNAPSDDDLATAIVKVSAGMAALTKSGLNRKAIVVLLKDASGVTQRDINAVLDGLADLKRKYCK